MNYKSYGFVSINPLQAPFITGKSLRTLRAELKYFMTAYYSHLTAPSSPRGHLSHGRIHTGASAAPFH